MYLHDMNSAIYPMALTQANVTATVTGPACDMIAGDGNCNLTYGTTGANATYMVANVFQCATSTGTYTAITGATIAATTAGVTALTFLRDSRWLQVRYDFAGTGITGIASNLVEQKKLANG